MLLEAATSSSIDVLAVLREFGFPVFFALWLMFFVLKRFDKLFDMIEKLLQIVVVMAKTIDADADGKERPPRGGRNESGEAK